MIHLLLTSINKHLESLQDFMKFSIQNTREYFWHVLKSIWIFLVMTLFLPVFYSKYWLVNNWFSEFLCSSSFDGHDEDGTSDLTEDTVSKMNGGDGAPKDVKTVSRQIPIWLSDSTPDEFVVWIPYKLHNLICFRLINLFRTYRVSILSLCRKWWERVMLLRM